MYNSINSRWIEDLQLEELLHDVGFILCRLRFLRRCNLSLLQGRQCHCQLAILTQADAFQHPTGNTDGEVRTTAILMAQIVSLVLQVVLPKYYTNSRSAWSRKMHDCGSIAHPSLLQYIR